MSKGFVNASHCFFMHVNFFIPNLHLSQNFSSDSLSLWHQGLTVDIVICVIHEALTSISHFIFLNCSELIWLYSFIFREFAVLFNLVKGMCKKFSHNTVTVTLYQGNLWNVSVNSCICIYMFYSLWDRYAGTGRFIV